MRQKEDVAMQLKWWLGGQRVCCYPVTKRCDNSYNVCQYSGT